MLETGLNLAFYDRRDSNFARFEFGDDRKNTKSRGDIRLQYHFRKVITDFNITDSKS